MNLTLTGIPLIDCKICHKSFRSISHTHLFFKHSLTQAEYIKDFKIRTIISPETRQILSKIHIGNTHNIGRKHTPDEIKKNSKRGKKLWKNPRLRKKIVQGMKKAWKSGEMRGKHQVYMRGRWSDPTYKAEMSEMSRRISGTKSFRRRRSKVLRKLWRTPSFRRKMAKRKRPEQTSPLTEEQWRETVGWLEFSPEKFGIKAVHWNLTQVRDLILEKWGVHLHENTVGVQFRKRGCKRVPISTGEPSNPSNSRYKFQKWVGPKG